MLYLLTYLEFGEFVVVQCMDVGFLNKPTTMAYDSKLQLLVIGNKAGDIRLYSFRCSVCTTQTRCFFCVAVIC